MSRHATQDASGFVSTLPSGERVRALRMALFTGAVLLGSTRLSQASDFPVSNLNDMGAGSLRQAVIDANGAMGADTISFAPGLTGTIALQSGINISDSVVITGPGAANLRISAAVTLITIPNDAVNTDDITIAGLTIDGGGSGAYGIRQFGETLRLNGVTITGCNAGAMKSSGSLVEVLNSNIINNGNSTAGTGGLYIDADLTVRSCTISGNAGYVGGVRVDNEVYVTIEDSTISDNIAQYSGGGILLGNDVYSATLSNVTISGNTAAVRGGGIYLFETDDVTIQNSTITGNTSNRGGGGVYLYSGMVTLESSIVAGNSGNGGANDLARGTRQTTTFDAMRSLIGAVTTGQINGTNTNNLFGVDPKISPLQPNGGPRQTHRPLPGSPAIDAGSNPATLTNDGRGTGFPRLVGAGVDIGAVELDPAAPTSLLAATNVDSTSPAAQYDFTVTFASAAGINATTLGNANVRVTGPGGFDVAATFVGADAAGNGTPRVATYRITPPGGAWDAADNGQYTISLVANQVADINTIAVPGGALGSFQVNIPRTFVVTTLADSGAGSLRQAVLDANSGIGADLINFQAGLTGSILLTSGPLTLTDSVTITGPGASTLTLSGNNGMGVLVLDSGPNPKAQETQISGLTITGSLGESAIVTSNENLTLRDSVLTGNSNGGKGGGAYFYGGKVTIQRCVITGNSGAQGGAFDAQAATILVEDTTFQGNTGGIRGGAIFVRYCDLAVRRCTVSGNSTSGSGGGFALAGNGDMRLENCTLSGNTANQFGGAVNVYNNPRMVTLRNCTIAGNISDNDDNQNGNFGSGLGFQGTTLTVPTIDSCIFADNVDRAGGGDINGAVNANFSLIENPTGAMITGANNILNQDPQLAALANNGGLTQTRAIPATSPALNAGSNPAGLTSDQRGPGFGRVSGAAADIGAFEIDATAPTAALTATNVTIDSPATQYDFIVTFNDDGFVDAATLGNGNVRVTGPNGFDAAATFVSATPAGNASPLAATYRITPPGGTWDSLDNGTYSVALLAGQVKDLTGNTAAAAVLGTFGVAVNAVPVLGAIVAAPSAPKVGETVVFSIPASDVDNDTLTYAWTFGDGGTSTAASPSRAFTAAGTFNVQVTVSDGKGGTAAATLSLTVLTPGGSLDPNDNDGDGIANASDPDDDNDNFSDEFETALGTDPLSPSNSPTGGVATPQTLTLSKLGIALNFSKGGSDKITLSGVLPVPAGFTIANAKAVVNVGGVIKPFTLSSKGAAKAGNDSFKIGIKAKKGVVAAQTSKFSAAFSKGTFPASFVDEGLTNVTAKKDPRTVRVEIIFSNALYRKDQPQAYTAGKGKGKTK